ncbi:hypothetical protein ACFQ0D_19180 [Micromonospora zhanjiangensis]
MLADVRELAQRVRLAQRVTWLPLLVLAVVTVGAIPVYLFGDPVVSNCHPMADGGQLCEVSFVAAKIYWLVAVILGYVLIARGYLRVARARGVDARVLPYVVTGLMVSVGLFVVLDAGAGAWILPDPQETIHPSAAALVLFRLLDPAGGFGVALLVLAWLERHVALLLFTLGYLAVVLVPINFGWGDHWGGESQFVPMLAIAGGVLLAGSAGFGLAQRLRRPR